ncbi:hypothetical protein ACFL1G_07565 [Planctomycetota bacterium]
MKNIINFHMALIFTLSLLFCVCALVGCAEEAQTQKKTDNISLIVELDKTALGFESSEFSLFRLNEAINIFDKETHYFNDVPGLEIGHYALAWSMVYMSGYRYTKPTIVYPEKFQRILSPGKYLLRIENISELYVKDKDIYLQINSGEMTTVTVKKYDMISIKTTDLHGTTITSKRYQAKEGPRGRGGNFYQIKVD